MKLQFNNLRMAFFTLLFCASSSVWSQTYNKVDENGLKQGLWKKEHSNGNTKYKGQFKDDQPFGIFKYYNDKGVIITILEYVSADSAIATHYHTTSKKAAYGYYVNQQKEGVWRFYDRKGLLSSKETFKAGVKDGEYIVYNLDGSISRETFYVEGIENGYRKTFDGKGLIISEGPIKDGQMDGLQKVYKGGELSVQGKYKHAVKDGEWIYYNEEGIIYKKELYELGVKKN